MDLIEPQRDARFGTTLDAPTPTEEEMKTAAAEKEKAYALLAESLDKISPHEEIRREHLEGKNCSFINTRSLLEGKNYSFINTGSLLEGKNCSFINSRSLLEGKNYSFINTGSLLEGKNCSFINTGSLLESKN